MQILVYLLFFFLLCLLIQYFDLRFKYKSLQSSNEELISQMERTKVSFDDLYSLFEKENQKKDESHTVEPHKNFTKEIYDFFDYESKHIKIQKTVEIKYKGPKGNVTNRIIDIQRYSESNNKRMVQAYCNLKQRDRSFNINNIIKCKDLESNESINDLGVFLNEVYKKSPQYSCDKLLEDEFEVLNVFLYVARSDGRYTKAEKVIVREACRNLISNPDIPDEMIDKIFKDMYTPSLHTFKVAVGRAIKRNYQNINILDIAKQIIGTQSKITATEQEALDYIEKKI